MIRDLQAKHLALETRVGDTERRLDGIDLEIGRSTKEGLRGAMHDLKGTVQEFIGKAEPISDMVKEMKEDQKEHTKSLAAIQTTLELKKSSSSTWIPVVASVILAFALLILDHVFTKR